MNEWTIKGADDQIIRCSTDLPLKTPRCIVLLAHGFKGYKDYGFIPLLAESLTETGAIVHRFNFSHSGMGENIDTFEFPELFEKDTWNKQVYDLEVLLERAVSGSLPHTPKGLPVVLAGHSRGGGTCLLTAGRLFRDKSDFLPAGVITMSAPDKTCTLGRTTQQMLLADGRLRSPSSRTGQDLYVGADWLKEQLLAPEDHDLMQLCGYIICPVIALHGRADVTVPCIAADNIAAACPDGISVFINEGNHVYNTPNPADPEAPISPQLESLVTHIQTFLNEKIVAATIEK